MTSEYLLFNIVVLAGPVFFGTMKQFYFWDKFKEASIAILLSSIPFLIWDVSVTNRHWFFSDSYTIGIRFFSLPIEEILFFITVPFACLFTWQMLKKISFYPINFSFSVNIFWISTIISIVAMSLILFSVGKEYTGLALLFFLMALLFDLVYGARIIEHNVFIPYFILVTIFTLLFNGYLTWRPIVTYDSIYQLDFRIFTVPIEDFFFGYALLIMCTTIYEKLLKNKQ